MSEKLTTKKVLESVSTWIQDDAKTYDTLADLQGVGVQPPPNKRAADVLQVLKMMEPGLTKVQLHEELMLTIMDPDTWRRLHKSKVGTSTYWNPSTRNDIESRIPDFERMPTETLSKCIHRVFTPKTFHPWSEAFTLDVVSDPTDSRILMMSGRYTG